jgi:predicted metal-dependent enzyme (double-stranded beta helix superfamily)
VARIGSRLEQEAPPTHAVTPVIDPPGRILEPAELSALAQRIAIDPSAWRPLVRHDPDERGHQQLYIDEHVGVWVISWMPGQDTGLHDHERSNGGIAVADGTILEERPRWGMEPRRVEAKAGDAFCLNDTELHRMANVSEEPAVTIHAYSPPIERMGLYAVDEDGSFRRRAIPWDMTLDARKQI